MSILSKSFKVSFTQVPNFIINDKNVSLKAKGLYLYMVSKPDNWEFSLSGMTSQLKESRDAILNTINELVKIGYLEKIKSRNENGTQATNDYLLHLEPQNRTESEKPSRKNRVGKTESEKSTTSNTKITNTEKSNTEGAVSSAPINSSLYDDKLNSIKSFIDMKEFLYENRKLPDGSQIKLKYDDDYISITDNKIPYFRSSSQNMSYTDSDNFYKRCFLAKNAVVLYVLNQKMQYVNNPISFNKKEISC